MTCWRHRIALCGIIAASAATDAGAEPQDERHRLAGDLARCAAYFFNATKSKPIADYEPLYTAGERAFNRAARLIDRDSLDRLVEEAATEMTSIIGGDWRNFGRVEARYDAPCNELVRTIGD